MRLEEVKRKSGSVWVVYDDNNKIVIITHDRNMAGKFMKLTKKRRSHETS